MSRDNFYGINISQERWDEIFPKKEKSPEPQFELPGKLCRCGHSKMMHNDIFSDGVDNGHHTECRICHCDKFVEAGSTEDTLLNEVEKIQIEIAKSIGMPDWKCTGESGLTKQLEEHTELPEDDCD